MIRRPAPSLRTVALLCALASLVAHRVPAAEYAAALADEAVNANPGLEALRARAAELRELGRAAGTWMDPVLHLDYMNVPVDSLSLRDNPMSAFQVRAQQTIPPRGWSRLQRDVADARTRTGEHAVAEAETRLRGEVGVLFWRLTLSRMLEALTREQVARASELLRAVRIRYETGSAGQHELLRLGVLRDRLRDDLDDFSRTERELGAALSRVLTRPVGRDLETPAALEPLPVAGEVPDWLTRARQERPELKRLTEAVRTEEAGAELARIEAAPDLTFWVGYRVREIDTALDDGTDQVSAGVSIPIPWGSRQRSHAERAGHLEAARAARARLAAKLDSIEAELTTIHARWSRSFDRATAYRDHLTPRAEAALETSLSAYTVDRADFSTLYQAEVDLLELERMLRAATVETRIQAALAHAAIGAAPQGGLR